MARNVEAVERAISSAVAPSHHLIALAKLYLRVRAPQMHSVQGTRTAELLDGFAKQQGAQRPDKVWVHDDAPTDELASQAVAYLTAVISAAQALLELTQRGEFIPLGAYTPQSHNIPYSTAFHGGGTSGGWRFEELSYPAAPQVFAPAYWQRIRVEPMTDPDIYVLEAGLLEADPEVSDSARDAVACLRRELYTPAVVMLGKVMEGAWIELGVALASLCPDSKKSDRLDAQMRSDVDGIAKKITAVRTAYTNKDWFEVVWKASDVRPAHIAASESEWRATPPLEFYVDFETVSDLSDDFKRIPERGGQALIIMIGCGHIEAGEWTFQCFIADTLTEDAEARVIDDWLSHMATVRQRLSSDADEPHVIHWSPAEESTFETAYNSATARHPAKSWPAPRWFDFLARVMREEPVVIRGAMSFGLKAVAKALYSHGFIDRLWADGPTDGLGAMVGAWWSYGEAQRIGAPVIDIDLMQQIAAYNEVDCRVMWGAVKYLRENH